MGKLNVTIPAVSVVSNGEAYRKVDRKAQGGDVIKITDTDVSYLEEGGFYAVDYVDEFGDPQITDDDGDEYDAGSDYFEVYEKVTEKQAEAPQQSQQYREVKRVAKVGERIRIVSTRNERYVNGEEFVVSEDSVSGEGALVKHPQGMNNGQAFISNEEYVVLEPIEEHVAEKAPQPERLKVGEYVKVIDPSGSSAAKLGDIAKIISSSGHELFNVETQDGRKYGMFPWRFVRATPEEVAAATKPKPTFAVGDHVRILVDTEDLPKGDTAKITEVDADDEAYPYRAELLDGSDYDWYRAKDLAKVTEEEIAQEAERAKWTKIGRKVDEYKAGDIVEVTNGCSGHKNGTIGICDGISHGNHCYVIANGSRFSGGAKLIVPVEQRFDRVS